MASEREAAARLAGLSKEFLMWSAEHPEAKFLELEVEMARRLQAVRSGHTEHPRAHDSASLVPDFAGIEALFEHLRSANEGNPNYDAQSNELVEALRSVFTGSQRGFADQVHSVAAIGDWAAEGVDLRNVPYFDELMLEVVLLSDERPFELYWRLGEEVFSPATRGDISIKFSLATYSEWRDCRAVSGGRPPSDAPCITLLTRG